MARTYQQFLTLIRNNITDPLLRQNTAKRQRDVMEAFAADYFNKQSDILQINQVQGLEDRLNQAGIGFQAISADAASSIPDVGLNNQQQYNEWVLNYLRMLAGNILTPAKPQDPQVNDGANLFSVLLEEGYPALSDYQGYSPYTMGTVILSVATGYIEGGRVYIKNINGPANIGEVGIGIASSGSRPASPFAVNDRAYTGAVVVVNPSTKATKPRFGTIDDLNNTVSLSSDYSYSDVIWGPEGGVLAPLGSNSVCSPGNIQGRLVAYVVADSATNRLQSDPAYSDPFSLAANANNAPVASISVAGGVSSVPTGQSVTLQLSATDADNGDTILKIEAFDNGTKIGEISGASGSLQTIGLTAGGHGFTSRATDSRNLQGPVSTAVSVTAATAGNKTAYVVYLWGQSPASGLSPRTGLPAKYATVRANIQSWDKTTGKTWPYSLGQINPSTGSPYTMQEAVAAGDYTLGANDHAITKAIVPSYDNGFGPDVAFFDRVRSDTANNNRDWFLFKTDLTPPVSTDGSALATWFQGVNGHPPLYPPYLSDEQAFMTYLRSQGYGTFVKVFIISEGEQDSVDYLVTGNSGTNPDFQSGLNSAYNRFVTDGIFTVNDAVIVNKTQRAQDGVIGAAQLAFVQQRGFKLQVLANPQFLARDGTHLEQASMLDAGAGDYELFAGTLASNTPYPVVAAGAYPISSPAANYSSLNFANHVGSLDKVGSNYAATGGSFGVNLGLADEYLPANTAGWAKFTFANANGAGAVLGFNKAAVKVSVFDMSYGILVPNNSGSNYALSIYESGANPFTPAPAVTIGRTYRVGRDADMKPSFQESMDGNNWRVLAQDATAYSGPMYPVCDVLGGSQLQVPQGTGLLANAGTGTGTGQAGVKGIFNGTAALVYTSPADYTSRDTSGNFGAANGIGEALTVSDGGILSVFDGTSGGIIGFHDSATIFAGFAMLAGIYYEAKPGGGFGIRIVHGGGVESALLSEVLVSGASYGVQRGGNNNLLIVRDTGNGLEYVQDLTLNGNVINTAATLYAAVSVAGSAASVARNVRINY